MARVIIKDQEGNELCKLDARHSNDIRDSEFFTADCPLTNGNVEYVILRHAGRRYIAGVYTKQSREASAARTAFYAALNFYCYRAEEDKPYEFRFPAAVEPVTALATAIELARGDNPR